MESFDVDVNGIREHVERIAERGLSDETKSSDLFWVSFLQEAQKLDEADSVDAETAIQACVSVLASAGQAIEHLEARVVALEAALSKEHGS